MKVWIYGREDNLYRVFVNSNYFSKVEYTENLDISLEDSEVVLCLSSSISVLDFIRFAKENSLNVKKFIYFFNTGENFKASVGFLVDNCVRYIPPRMTYEGVLKFVLDYFDVTTNTKDNILTFIGSDSKVGTTMVATQVAKLLAYNTDKKICLLLLNDFYSPLYIKESMKGSLSSLKPKIINNLMSEKDFYDNCIIKDNLCILPGDIRILDNRHFMPTHVEVLLKIASDIFDYVIVDGGYCGADGFNALGFQSIRMATYKYLITTQSLKTKIYFDSCIEQVFKDLDIKVSEFYLIVNKYFENSRLLQLNNLESLYNVDSIGVLPYMDMIYGIQCEQDRITFMELNDKKYNKYLEGIINNIRIQLQLEFIKGRKNIFSPR